jgi:hypothetical protein
MGGWGDEETGKEEREKGRHGDAERGEFFIILQGFPRL